MPYIKQESRELLDPTIDGIFSLLMKMESANPDTLNGNMNYIVTRLLKKGYTENYNAIQAAQGLLSCISQEFYHEVARPYEKQKKFDNGDVEA